MEKKILRAQRVAQLESDLNIIKKQLSSLVSFNDQETVISELASLSPDSDLIQSLSCLLYTSPSPRDRQKSRMPSSA